MEIILFIFNFFCDASFLSDALLWSLLQHFPHYMILTDVSNPNPDQHSIYFKSCFIQPYYSFYGQLVPILFIFWYKLLDFDDSLTNVIFRLENDTD